jgi:hypothetical protein
MISELALSHSTAIRGLTEIGRESAQDFKLDASGLLVAGLHHWKRSPEGSR